MHVGLTIHLARRSRAARQNRYVHPGVVDANYASRTMRWGGLVIFLFLIFHLMDFTWGVHPHFIRGDVYHNMIHSFRRVPVALIYIVANLALGVHLWHGCWSLFQSLGWNNPRFNTWRRGLATAIATIIVVGNCSFPIAVQAGIVSI